MAGMTAIALAVLAILNVAAGFQFECPENLIAASPPVVNETTYSYKVTISIEGKNETVEAYEKYDMGNGTVTLRVHFPDPQNESEWMSETIFHDYNYNQTFVIDTEAKTCVVSDLTHNETYSIFGVGIENGFRNPEFSFHWTGDYNYTMENGTYINGAAADKYSTCILFNDSQILYDIELYFAADGWNLRSGENEPLMVILKVNQTQDDGKTFNSEKYTYLFTSYSKDSSSYMPRMPFDLICPGRKDALPAPGMSNNFALSEEVIMPEQKIIFSNRRYYNYDDKLYRTDFVGPKNSSKSPAPILHNHHYTVIHDFHAGVEYIIDKELGNCTVLPISMTYIWDRFDVQQDPTGQIRMRNYVDFYKQLNMTYTGRHVTPVGMTVDAWTSAVPFKWNFTGGQLEITETNLYTTPGWRSSSLSRVPLSTMITTKSVVNGTTKVTKLTVHLSNVAGRMHGTHTFDVGYCFGANSTKTYVLKFDGSYAKYIGDYSVRMDAAMQETVAKAAKVSKVRVASWASKEIGTDANDDSNSDQKLFVSVSIYDRPGIHANTTEYVPGINLTAAIANLKAAVESNKLQVQFDLDTGDKIVMTAYSDYFKERKGLYSPSVPEPSPTTEGLSKGAIAALSIGMAVLGFVIGALACHLRYKRGNRHFGYSIQD